MEQKTERGLAIVSFFPLKPQLLAHCCIIFVVEAIWWIFLNANRNKTNIKKGFFWLVVSVTQVQPPVSALVRRRKAKGRFGGTWDR